MGKTCVNCANYTSVKNILYCCETGKIIAIFPNTNFCKELKIDVTPKQLCPKWIKKEFLNMKNIKQEIDGDMYIF